MTVVARQQIDIIQQVANISKAFSVAACTAAPLPTNTYSNGNSGQGATLTATGNGALTVDGYAVSVGDRIAVNDESAGANDGIYDVVVAGGVSTPYELRRSVDAEQGFMLPGKIVSVLNGTQAGKVLIVSNPTAPTMGTTPINFSTVQAAVTNQQHDQFTGDAATTAFNLGATPVSTSSLKTAVYVNGVRVEPQDYTVSSTQVTFNLAPPAPVAGETYNVDVIYNHT